MTSPVIDGEREVVRGDRARDGVAERLHALDRRARRRVLEDDAEPREARVQRAQVLVGNGVRLSFKPCAVLRGADVCRIRQFSTLTSNAVMMRLANGFPTDSIWFW